MDAFGFVVIGCSFSALLGSIVGSLTGLMPGLHPNSLASFFAAFPQLFALFLLLSAPFPSVPYSAEILFGCFLIGVLVSHSITEMIPTSTMGIADSDSISVLLPVQKLYSMGRADLISECVILGSLGALLIFTLSFYPIRIIMGSPGGLYSLLEPYLGVLLLAISVSVLLSESAPWRILRAAALFIVSGTIGVFVLTFDALSNINQSIFGGRWVGDPSIYFLPVFSGFFALPSLLMSQKETAIGIKHAPGLIPYFHKAKALLRSIIPMLLVGWIPGITNSYATRLSRKSYEFESRSLGSICSYVVTYSATNIGGSLQSIIALATILRARNGILESIKENLPRDPLVWTDPLSMPVTFLSLSWSATISVVLGIFLFRFLCERMLGRHEMSWFKGLRMPITLFILTLSALTSGPIGLLLSFTCYLLALCALRLSVSRVHLMGFLLVPVMIYFLTGVGS